MNRPEVQRRCRALGGDPREGVRDPRQLNQSRGLGCGKQAPNTAQRARASVLGQPAWGGDSWGPGGTGIWFTTPPAERHPSFFFLQ